MGGTTLPGVSGGASHGGSGGGAIKLVACGSLNLDGTVSANGNSTNNGSNNGGGGGRIALHYRADSSALGNNASVTGGGGTIPGNSGTFTTNADAVAAFSVCANRSRPR